MVLKQTTLCTGSMLQIVGREMILLKCLGGTPMKEDCASSVIVAMFFVEFVSVEENVVGEMHGPISAHSCMSALLLGFMANVVYHVRSKGVILKVCDIYQAFQIVAWLESMM